MKKLAAIAFVLFIAAPGLADAPGAAKPAPSRTLDTPKIQKLLKDAEDYINSLKTITGSFEQRSSNGASDSGIFYISKPGRMRLEYKSPILLVADGSSIVYHDKKLDQISYMSLDANPASIILKGNIRLTGPSPSALVREIREVGMQTEITLSLPEARDAGKLTMIFGMRPLSLEGWRIKDAQGVTTSVALKEIREAASLDSSLFKIARNRTIGGSKSSGKYY